MTCLPILCLVFFLTLFGNSELSDLPLAVVDKDNSTMSRQFVQMIEATAGVKVKYMPKSMLDAKTLMLENRIDGILFIPRNMEKDVYTAQRVTPSLYLNTVRLLNSSLIYKDVLTTAQMLSAGIEMQLLTASGKTPLESYNLALPIYYEKHLLFNQYSSYGYYLQAPFNTLMILLFAILFTLFSVGLEQKHSTAKQWLSEANGSTYSAVIGKALPYTIYYSLFAIISNFIIYGVYQTPIVGSLWLMALNSIVCIIAYQAAGMIIFVIIRKLVISVSISAALTTMSFTMSGLTFPLMAMYKPIYLMAHLFPFTYYMAAYVDITRGASPLLSLPNIAIMLIYVVIGILVAPAVIKLALSPTEIKKELI